MRTGARLSPIASCNLEDALALATLAIDPRKYDTLYGRGLVEAKLGRTADSERDIKAALAGRPTVKDEFAKMGVQ